MHTSPADSPSLADLGSWSQTARAIAAALVIALPHAAQAQLDLPGKPGKPGAGTPEPTDGSTLASLELIAERDALVPGHTTWLGLHFEIHDGWHLYWRNNGDTGAPMAISIDAPEGVSVGEILYPGPTWYPMPGGFVDFVYEGEVTLLVPLTLLDPPAEGTSLTIGASVDWLICKDMCLAGSGESSITLPVREEADPTAGAPRFARARLTIPRPMSEARADGVEAEWRRGRELLIQVPGARRLTFFPYESQANAYPEDVASSARTDGERLILRYDEDADDARLIRGALHVRSPSGAGWYEIVVTAPPEHLR